MNNSLNQILKAIKGLVVMSESLEKMFNSLFDNQVPDMWSKVAYPSLKPLGSWVKDLIERCKFIGGWIKDGNPAVYWISGFFFPQAFITGTLQNYARKVQISIHTISFDFAVIPGELDAWERIKEKPEDGCYIRGLYLEAAIWDCEKGVVSKIDFLNRITLSWGLRTIRLALEKFQNLGSYQDREKIQISDRTRTNKIFKFSRRFGPVGPRSRYIDS